MAKHKAAFYWCSSCGGCEESFVDLNEFILTVIDAVDITLMPVATDFKYEDIEKMDDKSLLVSFINGAVRTSEQEKISKLLRKKSTYIIAYGACSHQGGIVGLANFFEKNDILKRIYIESESTNNPDKVIPKVISKEGNYELELPEFYDRVYSLDQIIDVDFYIPGCPPTSKVVQNALVDLLEGKIEEKKGQILTENYALCKDCPRQETRPDKLLINEFKRIYEVLDNGKCFLEQGIICLGPSTRSGCESSCIKANMPCRGCFGPTDNVSESSAKSLSMVASIIESNNEGEIKKIINSIADPAGLFYKYNLPKSIIQDKKK